MAAHVVDEAEVNQREPLGRTSLDLLERPVPSLDVEVGGGVGGSTERLGAIRTPAASPGVERAAVGVADVVRRVAGRGEDLEAGGAGLGDVYVLPALAQARPRGRRSCRRRADARCVRAARGRSGAARPLPRPRPAGRDARGRASPRRRRSRWMCERSRFLGSPGSTPRSARPSFSAGMQLDGPQSKRDRPSDVSSGTPRPFGPRRVEQVDRLRHNRLLLGVGGGGDELRPGRRRGRRPTRSRPRGGSGSGAPRTGRRPWKRGSSAPGARSCSRRRRATPRA